MTILANTPQNIEDAGAGDDLLVWILAWSELAAFGALLIAFVVVSWLHPEEVAAGRARMTLVVPAVNTAVLLLSGWAAAIAATPLPLIKRRIALGAASAGGLLFVALKLYEYSLEGASLLSDDAISTLYVLMTGFHLVHVLFGSLVLALLARFPSPQNVHLMTTLWHVIDIVWLVMFPIVYLI
ncbi:NorE accessory protein for nitric oxide reductase [Rhizobium sp. AC44/96]|jgi:nitric oxide reductase NorE protein|uniref:cytochrome c oxidase subunit 3 n=2 Tax=unclassified Rhizobium TaxID=2613769 RepID=UPI00080FA072|nr:MULTISPECIES: cytochrome c oxidase subunit 3 [unclassified Rhizobium]MDM9623424.1 cytochrome c oxidase subunit 3 [Rhizobium sp. S96]OCJ11138.1 NorE accessory protein for nitric oxide reductase [Rhizobium sp. AC44/96]